MYVRSIQPLQLGHLDDRRAVPLIAQFRSHSTPETRFAVACALGAFVNEPLSVETLLTLMTDADEDVRDWATRRSDGGSSQETGPSRAHNASMCIGAVPWAAWWSVTVDKSPL